MAQKVLCVDVDNDCQILEATTSQTGTSCTPNSLVEIAFSKERPPSQWIPSDFENFIFPEGSSYYEESYQALLQSNRRGAINNDPYLEASELKSDATFFW